MEPTDAQLVRAAAEGDRTAFAEFVRRHGSAALRYCLARLRERHAAEDAAQEAMLRMLGQVREGRVPDEPLTWLLGLARHCCHEQQRQRARHRAEPLDTDRAAEERPSAADVADLLELLSESERSLVLMKHAEGLKCREIALRTGKPVGTVTSALARAYGKLRRHLAEPEDERS